MHELGLTDTVGARDGLDVDLRIPVLVEEDDGGRRGEVDAKTTSASTDQVALVRRVGLLLEQLDVQRAARTGRASVEASVCRDSSVLLSSRIP